MKMTLQLHHLHTDGPKPLYKKITVDEYERMTARIDELERMDTEHTLQIAKMNGYIHHLEEERRWRKFPDEKPKWGEEVLVVDGASKQYIVRFSYDMKWISWGNMNTCESKNVKYWMPLPSAPKEEK